MLELTGISRYTLQRFLKQDRFPTPVNKNRKGSGSANFFDRNEVDAWVTERMAQLPATSVQPLNGEVSISFTFSKREMSAHRRACEELQCTFEAYALDAIRWKTKTILRDSEFKRPNLKLVS